MVRMLRLGLSRGPIRKPGVSFDELACSNEASPIVRRELASAAIRLADKNDVRPLLHALMERKEDATDPVIPHLIWVAYEKTLASGGRQPPADARETRGLTPPARRSTRNCRGSGSTRPTTRSSPGTSSPA